MASANTVHASSTEHELDIYDCTSGSQNTLTTTTAGNFLEAHISTITSTAVSPRNAALSPLVALPPSSNQSQLDSHSTVTTSTICPGDWCLLLDNPLLFDHLQDWEHPVSLFDDGIDSGTLMMQNNGLYMDITQSQLAQSHLHLPQIDWGSNQEPPLASNNQATIPARPLAEIPQEGASICADVAPELDASPFPPFNTAFRTTCLPVTSRTVPYQPRLPRDAPMSEERSHDRPGKKPAAPFQPDPLKLEEFCRRVAGSTFAVDWIIPTFKYSVSTEALHRDLERKEIDVMDFPGGFEPHQAYDGFISKVGKRYECGLCEEGNRTRWKNKKDAPRHLRKFHFGLADVCKACGKHVFSRAEMKTHGCVRRAKDGPQAEFSGVQ